MYGLSPTGGGGLIRLTRAAISGPKVRRWPFLPHIALWALERFPRKYRYFASKCSQMVRKLSYDATKIFSDSWTFQLSNWEISIGNTFEISTTWEQKVNLGTRAGFVYEWCHPEFNWVFLLCLYGRNFESVADGNFSIRKLKSSAAWEYFRGIIRQFADHLGTLWSEIPVFSRKSLEGP